MKQEEILKALAKELFELDTMHQEYQDNDTHVIVDSKKEGNTLTIKVTLKEDKDKQEFEKWLENVDDDLFQEVLESFGEAFDLEEMYNSPDYKKVINEVKNRTRKIAAEKVQKLQKLLGSSI